MKMREEGKEGESRGRDFVVNRIMPPTPKISPFSFSVAVNVTSHSKRYCGNVVKDLEMGDSPGLFGLV